MNYTAEDFINVFQRYPNGIDMRDSRTCDKEKFRERFSIFTQGLLNNFDYKNALLSGGSLFTILDNTILEGNLDIMNSDLDLFITRSEDEAKMFQKLQQTVDHFARYAVQNDLKIAYMVRGLLLEVMIQDKRRIQILLINNTKVHEFISTLAAVHIHMYFDGELHASEQAINNIVRRETRMCRAPIKDVVIPVLIKRGITPVGDILTTHMDNKYIETLKHLDQLKARIDVGEDLSIQPQSHDFFVTTNRDELLEKARNIYEGKWNVERLQYLQQLGITFDIDLFDLSVRLPALDILYRCSFIKCPNGTNWLLQLTGSFRTSPAIFVEKELVIDKLVQLSVENGDILFRKTTNIELLERYFDRQIVFRYLKHLSHIFDNNGNIYEKHADNLVELPLHSQVNIIFLITINEKGSFAALTSPEVDLRLDQIMYADIIELQQI